MSVVAIVAGFFTARDVSAQTAVADPAAAVRALYANTAGTGITAIYDIGTRRLRKVLMARSICTVPLAQRVIVCSDTMGMLGKSFDVGSAIDGAAAGTKVVTITRTENTPKQIKFLFIPVIGGWQLDEITAPGVSDWRLAPLTLDPASSSPAEPVPTLIERPPPVASAPMRRADRQRRLTRQN